MKVTLLVAVILLGTTCALMCYDGCTTSIKLVLAGNTQCIPKDLQVCAKSTEKSCATDQVCGNLVIKGELKVGDVKKAEDVKKQKFCVSKDAKEEITEAACTVYGAWAAERYPGAKIECGKLLKCEGELCNSGHKMTAAGALLLIAMIAQLLM